MPSRIPSDRSRAASIAQNVRWAYEPDRTAATQPARDGWLAKLEAEVDPDGVLDPAERRKRAENLRRAHMQRIALKSAKARRLKKAS